MDFGDHWRALGRVPAIRTGLFLLGCLLLLITPILGVMPGPGGIFTFAAGAALVLRYSEWAKRRYVLVKRRHPKWMSWSDWALRRGSALRREEQRKRCHARAAAEAARQRELARVERSDGKAQLVLVRHQIGVVGYFIERRFDPEHSQAQESYWAVVGFSGLYESLELARAHGLHELERA